MAYRYLLNEDQLEFALDLKRRAGIPVARLLDYALWSVRQRYQDDPQHVVREVARFVGTRRTADREPEGES